MPIIYLRMPLMLFCVMTASLVKRETKGFAIPHERANMSVVKHKQSRTIVFSALLMSAVLRAP